MRRPVATISSLAGLAFALPVWAVCPVCTVAVGAGIGLSRWLGVDDAVSGIWIGGLTVSVTIWTLAWMEKKKLRFKSDRLSVAALYYLIVLAPLYYTGVIGHPLNVIWGVDKLLVGTAVGSVVFLTAAWTHELLKKRNAGKSYFPFQKVVIPVTALVTFSFFFNIF